MTYHDVINNLLSKIDEKMNFPINIVVCHYSANYIDVEFEFEERDIDKILHDNIPNNEDLSIVWIDGQHNVNYRSYDHLSKVSSKPDILTIENHLKLYKNIGITKDKKYKIYLLLLPDEIEYEKDSVTHKEDFIYEDSKYEYNEVILPTFNDDKYQNLYNYKKENDFINTILIEFIIRNAIFNNLLLDSFISELEPRKLETEEEFEVRVEIDFQNQEKEIDNILTQYYGLSYQVINTLAQTFKYLFPSNDNISVQIKYPEPFIQNININETLTEKELVNKFKKIQKNYKDERTSSLNLEEMLKKDYLNLAYEILDKFPRSFKKKQDSIVKALFIFDFIQAKKIHVDNLNQIIKDEYQVQRVKINQKYKLLIEKKTIESNGYNNMDSVESITQEIKILKRKEKQELKKYKDYYEKEYYKYPKMNTKYDDSIFYEISRLLNENVGQIKKLHSHINMFLKKKIL